jgi:simple sugar transport system substrate-binding protein
MGSAPSSNALSEAPDLPDPAATRAGPPNEETSMRSTRRSLQALVAVTAATVTLAACSSGGGANSSGGTGQKFTIAMVTHEAPGDTFWDKIRNGAEQAAKDHGVTLNYSNNQDAGEQSTLVQNAIDSGVDGLATTLPTPDAIGPTVRKAVDAGIPTVAFNAGINDYKTYGIGMYFGSDEDLAGQTVGTKISQESPGHTVCVIQEQGQVQLEARCAGVKQTFKGQTENLYVNGQDSTAVQSTIQAKLQQDKSIDYVVTLGAPIALLAVQSVTGAGSSAKVATFDLNKSLVSAVKSGSVQWAVDQQPFLQGYLAVDALWLYKYNANVSGGGTAPVLTGPAFITKDNVDSVAAYADRGTR